LGFLIEALDVQTHSNLALITGIVNRLVFSYIAGPGNNPDGMERAIPFYCLLFLKKMLINYSAAQLEYMNLG